RGDPLVRARAGRPRVEARRRARGRVLDPALEGLARLRAANLAAVDEEARRPGRAERLRERLVLRDHVAVPLLVERALDLAHVRADAARERDEAIAPEVALVLEEEVVVAEEGGRAALAEDLLGRDRRGQRVRVERQGVVPVDDT